MMETNRGKVDEFVHEWLRHRTILHDLLDRIGDEHTNYKPWSDAFSLGALAVHIVETTDLFVNSVKNGSFATPGASQFETLDDVRRIAQEYTERTKATLQLLDDSYLGRILETPRFIAPGKTWLDTIKDHEVHHKGQLYLYARLVGVAELPFFIVQIPQNNQQ